MQGGKRTLHNVVVNVGMSSLATHLCKLPMVHSGPLTTLFKSQQIIALASDSRLLLLCSSSLPRLCYADPTEFVYSKPISSAHFVYTSA